MALKAKGKRALQAAADDCVWFRSTTTRAQFIQSVHLCMWGELPARWMARLADDIKRDGQVFAVFSYNTPIGWRSATGWFMPPVRYSVTTTNHQNVLATAIAHRGFYAGCRW